MQKRSSGVSNHLGLRSSGDGGIDNQVITSSGDELLCNLGMNISANARLQAFGQKTLRCRT